MHTLWCFTWGHRYMWVWVTVPVCNNHHSKLVKKPIFLQFPLQMYLFVCCSGHSPILLAGFKCSNAVLIITPRSTLGQKMCKFRHHDQWLPDPFSGPPIPTSLLSASMSAWPLLWFPDTHFSTLCIYERLTPSQVPRYPCLYSLHLWALHKITAYVSFCDLLSLVYCPLGTIQTPYSFVQTSSTCDLKGTEHHHTET